MYFSRLMIRPFGFIILVVLRPTYRAQYQFYVYVYVYVYLHLLLSQQWWPRRNSGLFMSTITNFVEYNGSMIKDDLLAAGVSRKELKGLLFITLWNWRTIYKLLPANGHWMKAAGESSETLLSKGEQRGTWEAKLVARLLATAALWVRIQTSPKNTKWAT